VEDWRRTIQGITAEARAARSGANISMDDLALFVKSLHGSLDSGSDGKVLLLAKRHPKGGMIQEYSVPALIPTSWVLRQPGWHVWRSVCTFIDARNKNNAHGVPAVWVDIDPPDGLADPALSAWQKLILQSLSSFKPRASLIVYSGRGWHSYWLLSHPVRLCEGNRDERGRLITALNKNLVRRFSGDPSAVDLARLMRLPGTVNPKSGDKARIVALNSDRYELHDLVEALGVESTPPRSSMPLMRLRRSRTDFEAPAAVKGKRPRGRPRVPVCNRDLRSLMPWARALVVGGAWRFGERYSKPRGGPDRSRADMAAVSAMVKAGWSDAKIYGAFARGEWLIGARYRDLLQQEGAERARTYLARTIAKARSWPVAQGNPNGQA